MSRIAPGHLLIATGALHQLVFLVFATGVVPLPVPGHEHRRILFEVLADGVIAAIEPDPLRVALFWSACFGAVLIMLGALALDFERDGRRLPAHFGWQVLALGVTGGLMIPASGFWLVVPQGIWITRRARRMVAAAA